LELKAVRDTQLQILNEVCAVIGEDDDRNGCVATREKAKYIQPREGFQTALLRTSASRALLPDNTALHIWTLKIIAN
jgi:hypothetical protein